MDIQAIGECLGAALASFITTWLALVRPMSAKLKDLASPEDISRLVGAHKEDLKEVWKVLDELRKSAATHDAKLEEAARFEERVLSVQRDVEDRMRALVTDEEFSAYTAATNENVRLLTEKLGRATGKMDVLTDPGRYSSGRR